MTREGWKESYSWRDIKPDYTRCGVSVAEGGRSVSSYQCRNPAKYDPNSDGQMTRCGVHSKVTQEKRDAKSKAHYEEESRKRLLRTINNYKVRPAMDALRKIRDGDNNPRETARLALIEVGFEDE